MHLKRKMRVHQKDAEINTAFLLFNAVSPGDGLKAAALAAGEKGRAGSILEQGSVESMRNKLWLGALYRENNGLIKQSCLERNFLFPTPAAF